jgi:hypothetical protein
MPTSSFALEKGSIVEMKQWEPEGKIKGKKPETKKKKKKKKKDMHASFVMVMVSCRPITS